MQFSEKLPSWKPQDYCMLFIDILIQTSDSPYLLTVKVNGRISYFIRSTGRNSSLHRVQRDSKRSEITFGTFFLIPPERVPVMEIKCPTLNAFGFCRRIFHRKKSKLSEA